MKRKMSEQTKNANLGVRQRRRKCYGDHRQKDSVLKKEAPWGSNKTVHEEEDERAKEERMEQRKKKRVDEEREKEKSKKKIKIPAIDFNFKISNNFN